MSGKRSKAVTHAWKEQRFEDRVMAVAFFMGKKLKQPVAEEKGDDVLDACKKDR